MKFKKLIKSFTDINHYTNIANIKSIKNNGLKASHNGFVSAIPSKYDELSKSNYPKTQREIIDIYNSRDPSEEEIPISIMDTYPLKYRQLNIMDGGGLSAGYGLDPVIRVKGKTKNDTDINRNVKAYREGYDIDPRVEVRVPESNIDQSSLKFQVPRGMSDAMIDQKKLVRVRYLNKDGEPTEAIVRFKPTLKYRKDNYLNDIIVNKDILDMEDKDTKNNIKSIEAYDKGKFKSRGKLRLSDDHKTNKHLTSKSLRDRLAKSLLKSRHDDYIVGRLRSIADDAQKDYNKLSGYSRNLLYGE